MSRYPSWGADLAPGPLLPPGEVPAWLRPLVAASESVDATMLGRLSGERGDARDAAVLVLFGSVEGRPHVLLQLRADTLGPHSGQVSFPGGGAEPGDDGPVDTALREAYEEVGLPADAVRPIGLLPRLLVPVSRYSVTPVLAHWSREFPVSVMDPGETAAVARVPIEHLVEPVNRCRVRVRDRYLSPAFLVPGMLVWGFTAMVLTVLLELGGWCAEGDPAGRVLRLEEAWQEARDMPATAPPGGRLEA